MNKFLILLVSVITISAVSFNAGAANKYVFIAMDNSLETQTCIAAGNDNKSRLKKNIRKFPNQININKSVRRIANSLRCNNMVIANFAKKYNALSTYAYLNRYTSNKNRNKTHTYIEDITTNNYLPDKKVYVYVSND